VTNEKVRFPWRSISAILAVFGVLIIAFHLWIPLKLKYFYWRLYSDDNKICVAAVDGLKEMGKKGRQVLVIACGSEDAVEFLLENWDNVNKEKYHDITPLYTAARKDYVFVARLLIAKGYLVDATDYCNRSLLYKAVSLNNYNVVEILIKNGADVNAKDNTGSTPLHCAAMNGWDGNINLLLLGGANINAKDDQGKTPLDVTRVKSTIKLLRARGGKSGKELGR
jgi:hypothetical protein